jgi:pyridoxine 4-dehydrogenase
MSSPLHLDVFVVPYKPIVGLIAPMGEGEATWPATSVSLISGERDAVLIDARAITPIATVQNRYNLADRSSEPVLDYCQREGIGFIPWFPMATGDLARRGGPLQRIADALGATPAQLALAWLLQRSPVLLPIPGTSTVAHLEENVGAAQIELTPDQIRELDAAV